MFGEFTISCGDKKLSENDVRGSKSTKMLQYLIAHRDRTVSQNELIELLWSNSDNPVNALKTLVHRTRELLKGYLPHGAEFILSERGTYSFNTALDYHIDSGEFEKLCKDAGNELLSRTRRVNMYKKALSLYKGSYLSAHAGETWVMPIDVYFHTLYTSAVEKCVKLLYPMGKFADIVMICEKAMVIYPYDESTHEHLIKAMISLNEYSLAANQYNYLKKLLYEQYGTAPSPRLTEMFELVVKTHNESHKKLDVILGDLWEDELTSGGYFCEYEIFRYIFRLYCRENSRVQSVLPLLLITLTDEKGGELQGKTQTKAMQKLSDSISNSLRKRDVYTRYSRGQYLLLLPSTPIKDVSVVQERIKSKFSKYRTNNSLKLTFEIKDVSQHISRL
ncbi:MAG: winged helix-turn-helix domain-containing protein [Ruminiclostridium sp.]|nr:winged helix-turn-helix domain-containing protein [Ruminiclostridium sp.]